MKSLSLTQPHAVVMVGIPGSGKSFFAEKFADTFGAPLVSLDRIDPYAANPQAAVDIAHDQVAELLKTHLSIVLELDSATRKNRQLLSKQLRDAGYVPLFVWVQTDAETALMRLEKNRGKDASVFNDELQRFSAPHESEKAVVISGKHTYATQVRVVLKRLSTPRPAGDVTEREIVGSRDHRTITVR